MGDSETQELSASTERGSRETTLQYELPDKHGVSEVGNAHDGADRHELPDDHGRTELDAIPEAIQGRYELDGEPMHRRFSFPDKDEVVPPTL